MQDVRESRFVDAGPHRIRYHEAGTGFPIVCIHGGGPGASGWSNYRRNFDALSKIGRVVVLDLPGYGQSDMTPPDGPRIAFYANAIAATMDALEIGQADFLGNSLGGAAASLLAMEHPARARRLVLMGPAIGMPLYTPMPNEGWRHLAGYYAPPGPSIEKMRALIRAMVFDASAIDDALVEQRFQDSIRPEVVASQPGPPSPRSPFEELWRDLSRLVHPTLLVWGRDDRVVTFDSAQIVLRQLRNAELHVFAECGHWAQWEKAAAFNRLVAEFLGRGEP